MTEETFTPNSILYEPLNAEKILAQRDENGFISGLVLVDISDIIDGDLESLLDTVSEKLVGSPLGMEIEYKPVGALNGDIVMRVTLDPTMVLDAG
jgi:hypothetical protein